MSYNRERSTDKQRNGFVLYTVHDAPHPCKGEIFSIKLPAIILWYRTLEAIYTNRERSIVSNGKKIIVKTNRICILLPVNHTEQTHTWVIINTCRKVRNNITPEFQKEWIVMGVRRLWVWAYENPKAVPTRVTNFCYFLQWMEEQLHLSRASRFFYFHFLHLQIITKISLFSLYFLYSNNCVANN